MNKLYPSLAARRVACPGSHFLESQFPKTRNESAAEGMLAHSVLCDYLRGKGFDATADSEMKKGAELVNRVLSNLIGENEVELHIEKKLRIGIINSSLVGTPDIFFKKDDELHVIDYKYGHTFVDVFENYQLLEYAAGAFWMFVQNADAEINFINLHVIQPRYFGRWFNYPKKETGVYGNPRHQTWSMHIHDFETYVKKLQLVEATALRDDAGCKATELCKYCTARHACVELYKTVDELIARVYESDGLPPNAA